MRIVIDIDESLISRLGSLFIHPLSKNADLIRLYTPGFEYEQGRGQDAFRVIVLPDQQPRPPQQIAPQPQNEFEQKPELPQDFPPAQVPRDNQPENLNQPTKPIIPPEAIEKTSTQQPTSSDRPPLSIVTPENKDGDIKEPPHDSSHPDSKDEPEK